MSCINVQFYLPCLDSFSNRGFNIMPIAVRLFRVIIRSIVCIGGSFFLLCRKYSTCSTVCTVGIQKLRHWNTSFFFIHHHTSTFRVKN